MGKGWAPEGTRQASVPHVRTLADKIPGASFPADLAAFDHRTCRRIETGPGLFHSKVTS